MSAIGHINRVMFAKQWIVKRNEHTGSWPELCFCFSVNQCRMSSLLETKRQLIWLRQRWQNNHAGSKSNSHSKAHTHKHTHTHQSPRKDRIKKEWVHGFACRILALKNIVNWKWEPWTAKKMPKASMKQQGVYDKILHRPNILIAKNYIASINFH